MGARIVGPQYERMADSCKRSTDSGMYDSNFRTKYLITNVQFVLVFSSRRLTVNPPF